SFGSGTTVYQGDNRFSLKNILFFQNRLELRKENKYFVRAYATHENAGDSYDPYFTALRLLESSKEDVAWSRDYVSYWLQNINPRIRQQGYPQIQVEVDPNTGQITSSFDREGAAAWLAANQDSLFTWHSQAEVFANSANLLNGGGAYLQPGTEAFNQKFEDITTTSRNAGGTLFTDRSALYHVHGEYKFTPEWTDELTVGANGRLYTPISDGTLFTDTAGVTITNYEFGFYGGLNKKFLDDKLTASATVRVDKNQNFRWLVSPAASLVYNPTANNYLRLSFSSAIRNPTLTDQYLSLNVGRAILAGNINGVQDLVTIESLGEYIIDLDRDKLEFFDIPAIQPEEVKSFEVVR
ncbi:MAG: TonB-dependent receptor, partial [Bacteroidota bacterium]